MLTSLVLIAACGQDHGSDSSTVAPPVELAWHTETVPCDDGLATWGPPPKSMVALNILIPRVDTVSNTPDFISTPNAVYADEPSSLNCQGDITVTWAALQ